MGDINKDRLEEMVAYAGTAANLSRMLGVESMIVSRWRKRGQVSVNGLRTVALCPELNQRFPAQYLRPDIQPRKLGI